MHRLALFLASVFALPLLMSAALAEDKSADRSSCKEEVAAAFAKQRASKAFRMESKVKAVAGVVDVDVEYVPPDRMSQKIVAPGQPTPLETVLVGNRAWSRQGGDWRELMPAIAATIVAQVRETVVDPPKVVGEFECLGETSFDGKTYIAYRSVEDTSAAPQSSAIEGPVHRTIYVDPESGRPVINIVAGEDPDADPLFKGVYSYPTDIVIEGYPDAPLVGMGVR